MPGHKLEEGQVKNKSLFSKYRCHSCSLLLRDAVQPLCGHWLCETCILSLLEQNAPVCPRVDCGDPLKDEDSDEDQCYFPDNFVRREIKNLFISCKWSENGCTWEGKLKDYDDHLKTCDSIVQERCVCDKVMDDTHQCPEGLNRCPFVGLVCERKKMMQQENVTGSDQGLFWKWLDMTMAKTIEQLKLMDTSAASLCDGCGKVHGSQEKYDTSHSFEQVSCASTNTEKKRTTTPIQGEPWRSYIYAFESRGEFGEPSSLDCSDMLMPKEEATNFLAKAEIVINEKMSKTEDAAEIHEIKSSLMYIKQKLKEVERKLEKSLGVPDNCQVMDCSHNGQIYWNIPEIKRRLRDAYRGNNVVVYSLPFYTSSNGYKMCLKLHLLGEGTGKCTHLSLFFVLMRGEFDDMLKWPFENKVTFILIDPHHVHNIMDVFWPDPSSSSFKTPNSDMNVASGCPQFLQLLDLMKFVSDDSITIRCIVETKKE